MNFSVYYSEWIGFWILKQHPVKTYKGGVIFGNSHNPRSESLTKTYNIKVFIDFCLFFHQTLTPWRPFLWHTTS